MLKSARSAACLVERGTKGRTEHFTPVSVAPSAMPGAILELRMAAHDGRQLLAA